MKRKKGKTEAASAEPEYDARFTALTWDDLDNFAGYTSGATETARYIRTTERRNNFLNGCSS